MSDPKQFADMTPEELRAWRAAWKRGEAERWLATTAIPGVPRERQTEHHAPTAERCTTLVQKALETPLAWVVEAPHKVEADALLREPTSFVAVSQDRPDRETDFVFKQQLDMLAKLRRR